MKFVNYETRMDQTTFEPIHTLSIEITSTQLEDFFFYRGLKNRQWLLVSVAGDIEQILGIRFLEILDEFIAQQGKKE
jgi:hypothetical protein